MQGQGFFHGFANWIRKAAQNPDGPDSPVQLIKRWWMVLGLGSPLPLLLLRPWEQLPTWAWVVISLVVLAVTVAATIWLVRALASVPSSDAVHGPGAYDTGDPLFGREDDVANLRNIVKRGDFRAGILEGMAGSGKTSLIRAGLMPALKAIPPILQPVYVDVFDDPMAAISAALKCDRDLDLRSMLSQSQVGQTMPLLIILDHFESFYFAQPNELDRKSFFALLRACINDATLNARFLICTRRELLPDMDEVLQVGPQIDSDKNRYGLELFSRETARGVLAKMTHHDRVPLDGRVVSRLVDQLAFQGLVCPAELQMVAWLVKRALLRRQMEYSEQGGAAEIIGTHIRNHYFSSLSKSVDQQEPREAIAASVLLLLTEDPSVEWRAEDVLAAVGKQDRAPQLSQGDIHEALGGMVDANVALRTIDGRYRLIRPSVVPFVRSALLSPQPVVRTSRRRLLITRGEVSWGVGGAAAMGVVVLIGAVVWPMGLQYLPSGTFQESLKTSDTVSSWKLIAFDPTGGRIAADPGSARPDIWFWNAQSHEPLGLRLNKATAPGMTSWHSLVFSPKGTELYRTGSTNSGSTDEQEQVWIWKVDTGGTSDRMPDTRTVTKPPPDASGCKARTSAYAAQGFLAIAHQCGGTEGQIQIGSPPNPAHDVVDLYSFDPPGWTEVTAAEPYPGCEVASMAFNFGGDRLVLAYKCNGATNYFRMRTVQLDANRQLDDVPLDVTGNVTQILYGTDGQPKLITQTVGHSFFYSLDNPSEPRYTYDVGSAAGAAYTSHDGTRLAILLGDLGIRLFERGRELIGFRVATILSIR